MKLLRAILLSICILLGCEMSMGRDVMRYERYTTQEGLSHRMISSIVQDSAGYIWMSTWSGLCRFDGEEFRTFDRMADGNKVGRLALVRTTSDNRIWTIRQADMREFLLDTDTGLLVPVDSGMKVRKLRQLLPSEPCQPDSIGLLVMHDSIAYHVPYVQGQLNTNTRCTTCLDRQGNIWAAFDEALYQISFDQSPYELIESIDPQHDDAGTYGDEVRAFFPMKEGGILVGCKNGCLYRYDAEGALSGYVNGKGLLSNRPLPFGARIYCMAKADDGTLWLGGRGEGLFAIRHLGTTEAVVKQYKSPLLPDDNIYDIQCLSDGALLVATWGGGLVKLKADEELRMEVQGALSNINKIRHVEPLSDSLYAICSTQGLYLVNERLECLKQLSSLDVSCLKRAKDGVCYLSTLSDGAFAFSLPADINGWKDTEMQHLPIDQCEDIILSLALCDDGLLWLVNDNALVRYNPLTGESLRLDRKSFGRSVTFGEAKPCLEGDILWVGTTTGRMRVPLTTPEGYQPNLLLNVPDTLMSVWGEELPALRAVAIDYRLPRGVKYSWRLGEEDTWTECGERLALSLPRLMPGDHCLQIRCADANGIWSDQPRQVVIQVRPAIWHWATTGILVLVLLVAAWRYGRKRSEQSGHPHTPPVAEADDTFVEEITLLVKEHIDDPQLDVEKLTDLTHTSRTILYGKFKEQLNTSPAAFITEVRLQRAVELLDSGQYRVAEVAQMCGFADAKYFARLFKQRKGVTPARYLGERCSQ